MELLTKHQQKALIFDKHISLTANAGSGKTFVLSRRYLEIALSEKGSLRKIAAITFTDKAAGELYKKIAEYIESRFNSSPDDEEKKLLNKIRRQLVSANISTIHSFCIEILRRYPVEAGLDANFQPIDELTSDELIELSVEETIKQSLTDQNKQEDIKYLIRFFGSKYNFAMQLKRLIKDRKKIFGLEESIYNKNEQEISEFFYTSFINITGQLLKINQNEFIDALTAINNAVLSNGKENDRAVDIKAHLSDYNKKDSVEEKLTLVNLIKELALTTKSEIRTTGYLKKDLRQEFLHEISTAEKYLAEMSSLFIPENHEETEKVLAQFGVIILRIFDLAVGNYELRKKENGYLDYEDILIHTKNLLKIPSVQSGLSHEYKYIMVDEYQDTNEIQYRIFLPLLDDLRSGNLFVVGDEKQSIYMFRDADLEVFRLTKEKISSYSGEKFLLSLPDSFRMAPGICLFVNKLFRSLFSSPIGLFNEVKHSDLVCARQEDTESLIEILIGANEKKQGENKPPEAPEAEIVAQRIISLVNGTGNTAKLNWKDIAILVRKRKSFSSLEKIFIEKNIPFNIIGGKGFYQRQSVYDIYNYFSFLLDQNNDTALVGVLRSPFFNISDSRIYEFSLEEGEGLWNKILGLHEKDRQTDKTIEQLTENIKLAAVYSAPQILRKILGESPYLSVLAHKASGVQETSNISKLIRLTIEFQQKGFKTLYDYVNFLKESIEKTEDEAQAAITDESDSVKIMTLHQAKGLEFPAVFLYNAHEYTSHDIVKKGSIQIDKNFGLLTKVPLNNDYFGEYYSAPVNNLFDYISSRKEQAELKRLFYVGATRAKNYLFISAPGMEKYNAGSFMALLQEGLNIDPGQESVTITDELEFLKTGESNHITFTRTLTEEIRIIRDKETAEASKMPGRAEPVVTAVCVQDIADLPKGEMISATKFATYKQCPLKYKLTYELGLARLVENFRKYHSDNYNSPSTNYEFMVKENYSGREPDQEIKLFTPEQKGSIIHKILQKNNPGISPEEITEIIVQESNIPDGNSINLVKTQILNNLKNLFVSDIFHTITGYKNFFNEYEIYFNDRDYFLHGIIDKLIIDNKNAIIVDYKTDAIQKEEIHKRASVYFPQLKFYSYIVSRLFKELTSFELRLIFTNFPEEDVKEIISSNEAIKFGDEIRAMVDHIRLREFDQNPAHCKDCGYALQNSKCIVERA